MQSQSRLWRQRSNNITFPFVNHEGLRWNYMAHRKQEIKTTVNGNSWSIHMKLRDLPIMALEIYIVREIFIKFNTWIKVSGGFSFILICSWDFEKWIWYKLRLKTCKNPYHFLVLSFWDAKFYIISIKNFKTNKGVLFRTKLKWDTAVCNYSYFRAILSTSCHHLSFSYFPWEF